MRFFLSSLFPGARRRQLRRIAHYETLLQELQQIISDADASVETLSGARQKADALEQYYGSPLWKRDFADDEAGRLPKDLKRGVLSEDGIYNALEAYRDRFRYTQEERLSPAAGRSVK